MSRTYRKHLDDYEYYCGEIYHWKEFASDIAHWAIKKKHQDIKSKRTSTI